MQATDFLDEVRTRLKNPAITDPELLVYINEAFRDVSQGEYLPEDYRAQILDTVCHELLIDGKFPEVQSVSGGGVTTSFAANDPDRYLKRMAGRRLGSWVQ